MATKAIRVKNLADLAGVSSKEVLDKLVELGFDNLKPMSNVPQDAREILESHFHITNQDEKKSAEPAPAPKQEAPVQQTKPAAPVQQNKPVAPVQQTKPVAPVQQNKPVAPQQRPVPRPQPPKYPPVTSNYTDMDDDDDDDMNPGMKKFKSQMPRMKKRDDDEPFSKNRNKFNKGQKPHGKNGHDHDFNDRSHQEQAQAVDSAAEGQPREVHIKGPLIVKSLADVMGKKPNEIITTLMMMNVLASINQTVDLEVAMKLAQKMNCKLIIDKRDKEEHILNREEALEEEAVAPEDRKFEGNSTDLKERPPIVTFMGHVDHGKTSLQDAIRKTHVAAGEAGGITQNIGASVVNAGGKTITFVDTPGHEAFTQMRARGANVTDIVVLVVAADDGFMPQTIEALHHAKAAGVPIVVAINKMDLPDANPDRVLLNMQQNGLMPEDWGGEVAAIKVSARTGMGIPDLLERILLEAEMLELKANPKQPGKAYVLESQLEQGFGPTASIVVKEGSIRVGDPVISGAYWGKIKTLIDSRGHRIAAAGPSTPVKVVGLSGVPEAGTKLVVCSNINEAKDFAAKRENENRLESLTEKVPGANLEDLFSQMEEGSRKTLKVIVKADVRGSVEAIVESLKKLPSDKISVEVLHSEVGAITENDVLLAASSDAIVIGFHVRVNPGVNDLAKKEKVEIRLYSIIYELLEDIKDALVGRLEPEKREKEIGMVKILKIFTLSKGPKICGCRVDRGIAKVGSKARVFRNNELIFNGEVRSLRHFQDDVKEVHAGMECGIKLDNFMDFTEGDMIQLYEIELKKATL